MSNNPAQLTLADATELLETAMRASKRSPQTVDMQLRDWRMACRFWSAKFAAKTLTDVDKNAVVSFVVARSPRVVLPSVGTQTRRRAAIRAAFALFRSVGIQCGDPTMDVVLPKRRGRDYLGLTEAEVRACERMAESARSLHTGAYWALAETGATNTDISGMTIGDLDLLNGRVWLAGGSSVEARWGYPTDWGLDRLSRYVTSVDRGKDDQLLFLPTAPERKRRTAGSSAVSNILLASGLTRRQNYGGVRVWFAKRVFAQTGSIHLTARALGKRSLDDTAALIGWKWQEAEYVPSDRAQYGGETTISTVDRLRPGGQA